MEERLQKGTLYSGIGHAGAILWIVLGDWLFSPAPAPEIIATQVSMISEAEFQALQSAAPSAPPAAPEQPTGIVAPEPVQPEPPTAEPPPTPAPEPAARPEPEPQPEPEPLPPAPEPQPEEVVVLPEEQPLPSVSDTVRPRPKPADRVAPDPVDIPEDAQTAETPQEAVSPEVTDEPQVVEETTVETLPEESGDVLRTEATEDQDESLGMTASIRPKSRPARRETPAEPAEQPQSAAAEETSGDAAADAIAAALAEVAAEETSAETAETGTGATEGPAGPPLNAGEIGDIRSAIGNKWNLGAVSTETMRTVVVVRVAFSPDGRPGAIDLIESDGPSQAAIDTAFSAARRAVQRAYTEGGIPLPPDKYDTWKVLEFVFDANGMRFR